MRNYYYSTADEVLYITMDCAVSVSSRAAMVGGNKINESIKKNNIVFILYTPHEAYWKSVFVH